MIGKGEDGWMDAWGSLNDIQGEYGKEKPVGSNSSLSSNTRLRFSISFPSFILKKPLLPPGEVWSIYATRVSVGHENIKSTRERWYIVLWSHHIDLESKKGAYTCGNNGGW